MAVHVVGNVGLDTTFRLSRFPKPGETLNALEARVALGGKGANQAFAALRAGAETTLWSAVGDDMEAAVVRRGLEGAGLRDDGLAVLPLPTDRSAVLVDGAGENLIASAVACARAFDPAAGRWHEAARTGDVLVLQGNLAREATLAALATGRALGLLTILNASPLAEDVDLLAGAPGVVVVNLVEGETLTGERDPRSVTRVLCERTGGAAVVTLGAKGFIFAQRPGDEPDARPAVPADALDTSGAGDVFCGTLAARLSLGDGFGTALNLSAWAAAVAVTRAGTFGCGPSRSEFQTRQTKESV